MPNFFLTIKSPSEGLYKEKGSKFLSFAFPIETIEDAKQILATIKKDYHDARHVCYAYMLGPDRNDFRSSDDGEPSGTAGKPILGQLNSKNLTNILVVVVRYFGGILLGTGGLIVAYRQATVDALENAEIITKDVENTLTVEFPYESLSSVMRIVKEENLRQIHSNFEMTCLLSLSVKKELWTNVLLRIEKVEGIKIVEKNEF